MEPDCIRILNVDDNEPGRYAVTRILERAGFAVQQASSGSEALELAGTLPDLILLDVQLPDMSGLEVCRQLKSNPATAQVMVLHVSANFVQTEHRIEALENGADGYLTQPLRPAELIANVRSLVRLRRAENEARDALQEWRTTFNAIGDGVSLLDEGGRVLRCNQAMGQFLNRAPEQVIGVQLGELVGEWAGADILPPAAELLHGPPRELNDLRVGERWFRLATHPVPAGEHRRRAVFIVSDITERKTLHEALQHQAQELQQANTAKDEFLAMLGHELRNPLSPILNALELLRQGGDEPGSLGLAREVIERQTRQLARLVDDLLDVARITRGTIELRSRYVDLRDIARDSVQTTRPLISERAHQLELQLPEQPVLAPVDPLRVEQILSNLLNNAAKYTEPGGRIELHLEQSGAEAIFRVRDTGRGIPRGMLPHIFDLFTQVSPAIDRSQGGLGLGLTLVRRLAEMHDGSVQAASEGPGKGSEFTVRLPRSRPGAPVQPHPAEPEPRADASARGRRVLVVDDNKDARETLELLVELWGYSVRTAPNGGEAVRIATEWKPNVALIDIGLPGMNGYQVAECLRAEHGSAPHLIAVTGYGQPQDREQALAAGFNAHVVKPVDPDALERLLSASGMPGPRSGAG